MEGREVLLFPLNLQMCNRIFTPIILLDLSQFFFTSS